MTTNPSSTYLKIKNSHPNFIETVEALGTAVKAFGPIDEKTAQLIQLAGAAAIRSEGAVHSHAKRAIDVGVDQEAIYHTLILLTSTIGFPNVAAAMCWVDDIIDGN
ncbi:MAG TPA: carboxymuconolactone decarboxylase family protein [Porticoccaceae bacterium]|nr:carboxymuconolactone decarboxylase family protein [Porticoccaceae bacterium]HIK80462.1 carboxymuconolactone decarboxylase family protein [Porticoccaceae bacterium]